MKMVAVEQAFCKARRLNEYYTTLKKWTEWGRGVSIEKLGCNEVREFLVWVYERAKAAMNRRTPRSRPIPHLSVLRGCLPAADERRSPLYARALRHIGQKQR